MSGNICVMGYHGGEKIKQGIALSDDEAALFARLWEADGLDVRVIPLERWWASAAPTRALKRRRLKLALLALATLGLALAGAAAVLT